MLHSLHSSKVLLLLFVCFVSSSYAQNDSTKTVNINEIVVKADKRKAGFKKIGLYDGTEEEEYNILGFTQLTIFEASLTDEFWTSKEGPDCISGKLQKDEKATYLNLNWNKDKGGCDWVGFGFGWDSWAGKDIGYVFDTLAIEMVVRSTGDAFTNIPWAFSLEDYSGAQAWLGYNRSFLRSEEIDKEWTKVEIPLVLFPFDDDEVDLSNIKQLLVQVFSMGTIDIKSIKLIPFSRKLKKEATAQKHKKALHIDGNLSDWDNEFHELEGGHSFAVNYTQDSLFFAFKIKDATPRENDKEKGMLWDGDAVEIAFSTNPLADAKRVFLLLSDQHIGLNCGGSPYLWNWKSDETITTANYQFKLIDDGYSVELAVPVKDLYGFMLKEGLTLDFEVAIDLGDGKSRKVQQRWNSVLQPGFNESPQRWGKLILE